jgi:hypothetical protein
MAWMKMREALLLILAAAAAVAAPVTAGAPKSKKPTLEIRPTPRFGFSPMHVLFTAELKGGDDIEDFYCPELEWRWDDGGKSLKEGDCPAFEPGVTKIERRFTNEHDFKDSGIYTIELTLRKADRLIARQTVSVTVRPGIGDRVINP